MPPPDDLSARLAAAESAYREAVMKLVEKADDVAPLARVAEHLANMTTALRDAAQTTMERVDLFDSVTAAGHSAEHAAGHTMGPETGPDSGNADDAEVRDDFGDAGIHLDHFIHLMEAGETMAGHATEKLLRAGTPA